MSALHATAKLACNRKRASNLSWACPATPTLSQENARLVRGTAHPAASTRLFAARARRRHLPTLLTAAS
eukprot:6422372-Alexandrium_andersonii.AAC.1